jgi:hypothetical protein
MTIDEIKNVRDKAQKIRTQIVGSTTCDKLNREYGFRYYDYTAFDIPKILKYIDKLEQERIELLKIIFGDQDGQVLFTDERCKECGVYGGRIERVVEQGQDQCESDGKYE